MCGIYGLFSAHNDPASRVPFIRSAEAALRHRGPDGRGLFEDQSCVLGHTRLKILDLSDSSAQPMASSSGMHVMAFNGEIYNYMELRASLREPVGAWKSTGDVEVLLELLEQRGIKGLSDVLGMFAIALYDRNAHELLLIQDRFGKKPIYYATTPDGTFRFASEFGAILADGVVRRATTPDRIAEYLQYGYMLAPRTSLEDVHTMRPGHALRVKIKDGRVATESTRYWSVPTSSPNRTLSEHAWLEEFRVTLEDAVKIRLRSDVPLGSFLSGGVDSSVISLLANRQHPLRTFTVDFAERAISEGQEARAVANRIGSTHTDFLLQSATIDDLFSLVSTYGDLLAELSALATIAVCRAARAHVTVALTGDGADELLAGYSRYYLAKDSFANAKKVPWPVRRLLRRSARHFPPWLRGDGRFVFAGNNIDEVYRGLVSCYPGHQTPPLIRRDVVVNFEDPIQAALSRHRDLDDFSRMMAVDAETYIPGDTLVTLDRASMSVSLELRCPFLDHRLFEIVSRARPEWMYDDKRGKLPLQKLYRDVLPDRVFSDKKKGFAISTSTLLEGSIFGDVSRYLGAKRARMYDVIDPRPVDRLLKGYGAGLHQNSARICHLVMLNAWFDLWKPQVSATTL